MLLLILGASLIVLSIFLGDRIHKNNTTSIIGQYSGDVALMETGVIASDIIIIKDDHTASINRSFKYDYWDSSSGVNYPVLIRMTTSGKWEERMSHYNLIFDPLRIPDNISSNKDIDKKIRKSFTRKQLKELSDKRIMIKKPREDSNNYNFMFKRKNEKGKSVLVQEKYRRIDITDSFIPDSINVVGYLAGGSKKYEIEMFLKISPIEEIVHERNIGGYYRYLSKPKDARLNIYGVLKTGNNNDNVMIIYCPEGVERFDLIVEDNSTISGSWRKYNDWKDVIAGGDNYRRKLDVEMRSVYNADNNQNLYDYPHTSERLLTESDLLGKSKDEIKIMRNEIFARHGYIFKNKELNEYFSSKNWYHPKSSDVTSELSEIEIKNIEFLKKHE